VEPSFPPRIVDGSQTGQFTIQHQSRELEVLELLAKGLANKEIASVLDISQLHRAQSHQSHLCSWKSATYPSRDDAVHRGILTMPAN